MYWWDVHGLAADLAARRVSERDKMLYYVLTTTLYAGSSALALVPPPPETPTAVLAGQVLIIVASTLAGILICYEVNRRTDDRDFLDRMVCLSWPVTIRLAVVYLPLYTAYLVAGLLIGGDRFSAFFERPSATALVWLVIVYALNYAWLATLIRRAGTGRGGTPEAVAMALAPTAARARKLSAERNAFLTGFALNVATLAAMVLVTGRPPSTTRELALACLLSVRLYFPFFVIRFARVLGCGRWSTLTCAVLAFFPLVDLIPFTVLLVRLEHARSR